MKKAKKAAEKARRRGYHDVRLDTEVTKQQQTAEIKGLEASHIRRYTPAQENEAYRESIRVGNCLLYEDVGSFPDWVQQAILQRQSSSRDERKDGGFDMTTAKMPPVASGSGSELQGYSTLLGASYSNVQIKEIPWWFAGDPRWSITFDDRDPIDGHPVDVVPNNTALKTAKTTDKRQKRRKKKNIKTVVKSNQEYTEEEKAAKIAEIDQDHLHSYTPTEEGEAYTESIRIGNRPPHKDLSDLPDWVQQEILQRQSSSEDDLQDDADPLPGNENMSEAGFDDTSPTTIETAVGQPGPLPGNEIETKLSFDDTGSKEVEQDADPSELQPSHVMSSMSTMKQPVTVSDSQLQMPQAFAEQENLTQQAEKPQQHLHQHQHLRESYTQQSTSQQPSSQQPPSNQQSSSTQATAANILATTTGLSYEEIQSLIFYGKEGLTSHQALRSKMAQPNILQVDGIQEMIAEFCTKIIWQRYCRLPRASDATPDFTAITSNSYDNRGVRAPTHPIPASFLERLMRELNRLFEFCRECGLLVETVLGQTTLGTPSEVLWAQA